MDTPQQNEATATPIATTTRRVIVPDPLPAQTQKVLPCELAKYEANGYGTWSYAPGLAPESGST